MILREYFSPYRSTRGLPPGIAMTRMPGTVQSRLPYRAGEEIIFIEDDAYLIQKSTQIILDVLNDVL